MDPLSSYWRQELDKRRAAGLLRRPAAQQFERVDFASNDYLGLVRRGRLLELYQRVLAEFSPAVGATGSRLLTGLSPELQRTEQRLAEVHAAESALIFTSAYQANLTLFSALLRRGDTYLYDEAVHASIRDGLRLATARAHKFPHNDLAALAAQLHKAQGATAVVTESVFSMDGDSPPLADLVALCHQYGAWLVVDEAHALGVCGPEGLGLAQPLAAAPGLNLVRVLGFGKALGLGGGALLAPELLTTWLLNTARPLIYTTAPTPLQAQLLELLYREQAAWNPCREELAERVALYDALAGQGPGLFQGAIRTLRVPGNQAVMAAQQTLWDQGLDVRGIRSPTVPAGGERLRIVLHAHNTPEQIRRLSGLVQRLNRD